MVAGQGILQWPPHAPGGGAGPEAERKRDGYGRILGLPDGSAKGRAAGTDYQEGNG